MNNFWDYAEQCPSLLKTKQWHNLNHSLNHRFDRIEKSNIWQAVCNFKATVKSRLLRNVLKKSTWPGVSFTAEPPYNTVYCNAMLHLMSQRQVQDMDHLVIPKGQSIPRPHGRSMECLWRKLLKNKRKKWSCYKEVPLTILKFIRYKGMDSSYHQSSNISHTLVGNEIVDHSDVVGASPVGAAPTTPSFSTWHLAVMDQVKTRRETSEFGDLVRLILEVWRYSP